METCIRCGRRFNMIDELDNFMADTFLLNLQSFRETLCPDCAYKAIEIEREEDLYFEVCEECGDQFDLILEENDFSDYCDEMDTLRAVWDQTNLTLCSKCARKHYLH